MRKSILLILTVCLGSLAGCGSEAPSTYTIVADVPDRAERVRCDPVAVVSDPAPTEVRLATDSTWTLLSETRREIFEFDDRLRVLARTTIPAEGPGAAPNPVSVAALGDTAWAVAARGGLQVVLLSRGGRELATIPLDFIPHSLAALDGEELLLTAMPFGTLPSTVLVRIGFRGTGIEPVPVPRRSYADMTVNALGNVALVETLADGTALVVHQFMEPRGFRVGPDEAVEHLLVPTPAGSRDALGYVPRPPITDDQMARALVPAIAMSVDRTRDEVYLLTRSGREVDGRPERAILRTTGKLAFLEAFVLDVPAAGMVYLPRTETAVVYDDADAFFACPLPRAE